MFDFCCCCCCCWKKNNENLWACVCVCVQWIWNFRWKKTKKRNKWKTLVQRKFSVCVSKTFYKFLSRITGQGLLESKFKNFFFLKINFSKLIKYIKISDLICISVWWKKNCKENVKRHNRFFVVDKIFFFFFISFRLHTILLQRWEKNKKIRKPAQITKTKRWWQW